MTVDFDNKQLAEIIGNTAKVTNDAKQDFFESEQSPDQNLVGIDNILIEFNTLRIPSKTLGTSAFVIDHPVYGDIDSSTLNIDGNFASLGTFAIVNNNDIFKEQLSHLEFINSGSTTASVNTTARTCTFGVSSSVLESSLIAKDSNRLFSSFSVTAIFTGTLQCLVTANAEAGSPTYTTINLISGIPVSGTFSVLGSSIKYKLLSTDAVLNSQLLIKYS